MYPQQLVAADLTLHKDLVKVLRATMPMHIGSPAPGLLMQWDVAALAEEAWQADMSSCPRRPLSHRLLSSYFSISVQLFFPDGPSTFGHDS